MATVLTAYQIESANPALIQDILSYLEEFVLDPVVEHNQPYSRPNVLKEPVTRIITPLMLPQSYWDMVLLTANRHPGVPCLIFRVKEPCVPQTLVELT